MIFFADNFELYDDVRTSGTMDSTWLSSNYSVIGTTSGLVVGRWPGSSRIGLGTLGTVLSQRSVYYPLGKHLTESPRITLTQKLLGAKASSACIGGLVLLEGQTDKHLVSFGFHSKTQGFLVYAGLDGKVKREVFTLQTQLSGEVDWIEWSFVKDINDRNEYRAFTLHVNNKPAFAGNILCQVGSAGTLAARISGGVTALPEGTNALEGRFVQASTSTTLPQYGTTDFTVSDKRIGLTRTLYRAGSSDIGPNNMTPSTPVGEHAEILATQPPSTSVYLTADTAAAEEMFGATAFEGLSSEAILAYGLVVAANRNNPFALDLAGQVRIGQTDYALPEIPVDITPKITTILIEKNPATGLPFTPLEANSTGFGLKVN